MIHTHMFVLDRTDHRRLDDGSWHAEFPGRTFRLAATAPTLEQARSAMLTAIDEKLLEIVRDDLQPAAAAVTQSPRKQAGARRLRTPVRPSAKGSGR